MGGGGSEPVLYSKPIGNIFYLHAAMLEIPE